MCLDMGQMRMPTGPDARSPRLSILPQRRLCQSRYMIEFGTQSRLAPRLVDSLYVEAMLLADEVRGYFDVGGTAERDALSPRARVAFACESLKVTTRLMHIVSWLLTRRAVEAGEIAADSRTAIGRPLGEAADSDPAAVTSLPETARVLIEASRELYQRVCRLDQEIAASAQARQSPARGLLSRLEQAF